MNAPLNIYTLAVLPGVCALFAFGQAATPQHPGFPEYPPIADADPSIRHQVEVSMPARLSVHRTSDGLSISYDLASLRKVKVKVGQKMSIGIKDELRVYPTSDARPLGFRTLSEGSMNQNESAVPLSDPNILKSTDSLNRVHDGIPAPGKRYVIEHDITLFETDIPPQHMWQPESGKKFRVLWEKKLKARS